MKTVAQKVILLAELLADMMVDSSGLMLAVMMAADWAYNLVE